MIDWQLLYVTPLSPAERFEITSLFACCKICFFSQHSISLAALSMDIFSRCRNCADILEARHFLKWNFTKKTLKWCVFVMEEKSLGGKKRRKKNIQLIAIHQTPEPSAGFYIASGPAASERGLIIPMSPTNRILPLILHWQPVCSAQNAMVLPG